MWGNDLQKTSFSSQNAPFLLSDSVCMGDTLHIFLNLPEAKNSLHNKQSGPKSKAVFSVVWLIWCFLPANSLILLLCLCLLFFFPPSRLTGCHHIFSQLPTTSYSATTDLNTDLASSVPLRRERERYPQPPPAMLQGENFACLISLLAARVHLVISSRFLHIFPFS